MRKFILKQLLNCCTFSNNIFKQQTQIQINLKQSTELQGSNIMFVYFERNIPS